jgi:short-chain fatty acids transporter
MASLLPRLAGGLARFSARYVPDAFSIACLLVLLTLVLGLTLGGATPLQCVEAWGKGFWELLAFSMQMVVVIFAGYVVAVSPLVTRLLDALAGVPRSPRQAVAWTAFLSMMLCWLNWGAGLIAAAMLVRSVARRHPQADYRLLVAVAYLGLGLTWHAGPSGSVPLLLATPGSFMIQGGLLDAPVPLAETIGTPLNLWLTAAVVIGFTGFVVLLHPPEGRAVGADAAALGALSRFEAPARPARPSPAERLMFAPLLNRAIGLLGLLAFGLQMGRGGSLTLDSVNLLFLSLGIALHPHPASLVKAGEEAARSLHGVVLQFPLYAGIYGIIKGTALAEAFTQAFLSIASPRTYELVVFWYSAVLDYFVPSGGGKWAIEAPYVLGAGRALGVAPARVAMAYAYGDMAANLIQPFWAIPLLGVARLEFRDILGYEILVFSLYALVVSAVLLVF